MSDPFGRYARREYERRWLLPALPAGLDPQRPWARITDHYLDGTRFRVRERVALDTWDVVWKLTHKFPEREGAHDRAVITNNYLTRDEYERFRRLGGREVTKHRWIVDHDGGRFGVDAYLGPLSGLITAEREYATHEELVRAAQLPPPLGGVDVTGRPEFTGGALAGASFDALREIVGSLLAR